MSSQKFCSFLYLQGGGVDRDAQYLDCLPSLSPDVNRHDLGEARLYVSPGKGNALHRHFVGQCHGFVLFLQGEFYEETDLQSIEGVVGREGVDTDKLARFLELLNGVFSGFIASGTSNEVWSFNDRFGMGHSYVSQGSNGLIVSSNIWPALCNRGEGDVWYKQAFHEILLFGYPLRDRTPLENTRIVQPGLILNWKNGSISHIPYHSYDRLDDPQPRDYIREFESVAQEHFESIKSLTGWDRFGATLSGGHDSRVVVNAMMALGVRPRCYIGYDNYPTWDSKRGEKVARAGDLPFTVFDYQKMAVENWVDANVLADGSGTGSWSMNLAKVGSGDNDCLYFGTSGDPVSGGWKIFPHDYDDVESMAVAMMKAYYFEYSTPHDEFVKIFDSETNVTLMPKFTESFLGGRDLVSAFLINFYREGNFRRVRMFMQGAYLYSSPIHFFHDRRVYEFYSRLPYGELIGQKVHNRLCYFACRKMGTIPASNFPVPVALEPWLLPLAKKMLSSKLRTKLRPMTRKSTTLRVALDSDVAECLENHGADVGIDFAAFSRVMAEDSRCGVLALRAKYVANILSPEALLAGSKLIGPKRVHIIENSNPGPG